MRPQQRCCGRVTAIVGARRLLDPFNEAAATMLRKDSSWAFDALSTPIDAVIKQTKLAAQNLTPLRQVAFVPSGVRYARLEKQNRNPQ